MSLTSFSLKTFVFIGLLSSCAHNRNHPTQNQMGHDGNTVGNSDSFFEESRVTVTQSGKVKTLPDGAQDQADIEPYDADGETTLKVSKVENNQEDLERKKLEDLLPQNTNRKISSADSTELNLKYPDNLYDWWITYFTKKQSKRFNRHLNNGDKHKELVKSIFKEHGLPGDLYYVGLIESGYNTYIRSRASAVGPWQFIKGTATRYGLRVDRYVDERTNLIKATHAAASYFKDLYNIFGSWELALCAYNAGEYRIINVIRKGNTRDYRKLVELKLLPKETVYYIPKVAAAKYLADNPSRYGFVINDSASSEFAKVKFHRVPHSFNTRDVLKSLNVSQSEFKKLNPDIKNSYVRVTKRRSYRLLIPEHKTLGSLRKARPSSRDIASSTAAVHKVRSGENLSRIAKRYGLGVSKLKRLNGLRSNKIFVGQRLKTGRAVTQKASRSVASRNKETHVVRSGENLSTIARKYSTSVGTLKNFNKLRSSKIFVGQKLRVPASNSRFYTVRKGDNLYKIAKRHGVSLQRLKRFNKMKSGKIFPGQRLQIPLEG